MTIEGFLKKIKIKSDNNPNKVGIATVNGIMPLQKLIAERK